MSNLKQRAGLSAPAIFWNGRKMLISGGSFKMNTGGGESKVVPVSGGGGEVDMVISHDVSTYKSKFSFKVPVTAENIEMVELMIEQKRNFDPATFRIAEKADQYLREQCYLINDPDLEFAMGAEIELEFEGKAAV